MNNVGVLIADMMQIVESLYPHSDTEIFLFWRKVLIMRMKQFNVMRSPVILYLN